MQYRTHFTTSLAVTLPIMTATGTLSISSVIALGLGSVFPDIDEPHSWIGARTRGLSDAIKLFFGHRGLTHSLFGLILAMATTTLLLTLTPLNPLTGTYFVLGYALHLVEDSFSKSGVKWLLPMTDKPFRFGKGVFYYVTGGVIERFIFLSAVIVVIWQLFTLDYSQIELFRISKIEIIPIFSGLIEKAKTFVQSKI